MAIGYPVRVQGRLDPQLSRWLWLVKWFLAIPHYIVLVGLWIAFVAVSLVAFVAVLVTGRYPRSLFDFTVGVLRWSWRVSYYTFGALGTDRYPPFTLADVPDYPARLEVDYPETLSRGLVLVKWWLLALPHYLVVALFAGGATWGLGRDDDWWLGGGGGLIGLLVLVAAVVLTVTGRYPHGIFDLVLGLNRWVLRVAAYAGLMTDAYPPFRLDMGGEDPGAFTVAGTSTTDPAPTTEQAPTSASPQGRQGWGAVRILGAIVTAAFMLLAIGLMVGGLVGLAFDRTQRDDDGFLNTGDQVMVTDTAALTSEDVSVDFRGSGSGPEWLFGDVQVLVDPRAGKEVFVCIADRRALAPYLAGFAHDVVTDVGWGDADYERVTGPAADAPDPRQQTLWTASVSGAGKQRLTWEPSEGDWVLVVMNADGSPGVDISMSVGAELPLLTWVVVGMLVVGGVLFLVCTVVLIAILRR